MRTVATFVALALLLTGCNNSQPAGTVPVPEAADARSAKPPPPATTRPNPDQVSVRVVSLFGIAPDEGSSPTSWRLVVKLTNEGTEPISNWQCNLWAQDKDQKNVARSKLEAKRIEPGEAVQVVSRIDGATLKQLHAWYPDNGVHKKQETQVRIRTLEKHHNLLESLAKGDAQVKQLRSFVMDARSKLADPDIASDAATELRQKLEATEKLLKTAEAERVNIVRIIEEGE